MSAERSAAPAMDMEKLERLYISYKQPMYHAALRILRQPCDAEDAVHDTFVKIMGHLDKLCPEDECKTRGFLVVAAERTAIDHYRRRKRLGAVSLDCLPEQSAACGARDMDDWICIYLAFFLLPTPYATLLWLRYFHGYTDTEISIFLSISEPNVRKRISRAKSRLHTLLEERRFLPRFSA